MGCGVCTTKPMTFDKKIQAPPPISRSVSVQSISSPNPVFNPNTEIIVPPDIDDSGFQTIIDELDFDSIIHADPNFSTGDPEETTIVDTTNNYKYQREPMNDGWKEKYLAHGQRSNILADVNSNTHACVNSSVSEKIDEYLIKINQITTDADGFIQQQIALLSSIEETKIKEIINKRDALIGDIVKHGNVYFNDYERYYRRLIEEYIRQLEIEMTKRLDDLHKQLDGQKGKTFNTSQNFVHNLTIQVENAKRQAFNNVHQKARTKINQLLGDITEIVTHQTPLSYEQLTTVNLQIYSNVGMTKNAAGCNNIPDRATFIDEIDKAKPQIKRTVYLGSNPNVTLPRDIN